MKQKNIVMESVHDVKTTFQETQHVFVDVGSPSLYKKLIN